MSSNKELLAKADWALANLASDGGLLNPEQANTFIRKLLAQPTLLAQARRVVMNAPQRKINKIQFASRMLKAAVQGGNKIVLDNTANKERSAPTTEQIQLNTKEIIAEVRLPYEVIEDNIERGNIGMATDVGGSPTSGGIVDTIMDLIAERAALDLEEWALLADTASGDPFLALTDGWIKRCNANVVDLGGAAISRAGLTQGMKTLPSQYRRNRASLRHFVSTENEIDYRDTLARRETSMGDSLHANVSVVYAAGSPVEGVALMPAAKGLLCDPLNLIFGVQRQLHIESDKDIRQREYIVVLTMRADLQVEEDDATVKYINFAV